MRHLWLEKNIRGGICYLGKRLAIANNPYCPNTYEPNKPNIYVCSFDINNLYGHSLSQYLPHSNFCWLSESEIENFSLENLEFDDGVGYIIECHLHYLEYLHKLHDIPLAINNIDISFEMLSAYQRAIIKKHKISFTTQKNKLTPNFLDKKNYVTHYLNLKFYLKMGLELKKIHRILAFTQKQWLKLYINFNSEKRELAENKFEKNLFKQMNNSIYGKSLQSPRKRINMDGCFNVQKCQKKLGDPLLEYFEIINQNFCIFKTCRKSLFLNNPIFVGYTVLENSKLLYDYYYSYFKKTYKENCEFLYSDTDSITFSVTSNTFINDLKGKFKDILDFSHVPKNHVLYSDKNHMKIGKLKFDTNDFIEKFVGIKSKMYSFKIENKFKNVAKGVKKSVTKNFTTDLYQNVIEDNLFLREKQYNITATNHELKTVIQN